MKSIVLVATAMFFSVVSLAQGNLVQNGSFESISKKIKESGTIEFAYPWTSPTSNKADLFSVYAKSEDYGAPKNVYGDADPKDDGKSYAGVNLYSAKGEAPKQYISIKLKEKLEEEKVYCVKMSVLLAMMSKYSCNNIGIFVHDKPLTEEDLAKDSIQPQIMHSQNKIFDDMFEWQDICQTYIAKGGEQYITIGNFSSIDETQSEKVKKPKGVTGVQSRGAYYYIDEVSVENMAGVESCDCELDAGGNSLNVVYSVNVSTEVEFDASEEIEMKRIYFDELVSTLNEAALSDVEKVAKMLIENPQFKIKVIGHTDPVEEAKATGDVSVERANTVKDELVRLGVPVNRILVQGAQDFDPATRDVTVAGQAQNRRVVFEVISK